MATPQPARATDASEVRLARRPLPDQLRYLARKLLDGTGTDPVAAMVAFTLQVIADEQAEAASAALLSLAAELEADAEDVAAVMESEMGFVVASITSSDLGTAVKAFRRCARMARSRAQALAGTATAVSRAPGDSPGGTGPQNPAQSHEYLSTSCLHGKHAYCQATTGSNGDTDWVKAPAVCKFCPAPCVCPCHRARTGSDRKEAGDGN